MKLTEHFTLEEFLPVGVAPDQVPDDVRANLALLATAILEPVRERFDAAVYITSGWRPPRHNASVGGAATSDHVTGRAADFYVADTHTAPWEVNTTEAFAFIRTHLSGAFGQIIYEDHRAHFGRPGKLWVHAAIPSPKHPGDGSDADAVLYSYAPGQYRRTPKG